MRRAWITPCSWALWEVAQTDPPIKEKVLKAVQIALDRDRPGWLLSSDRAYQIFDQTAHGFVIAIPGVLLSSLTVVQTYSNGQWHLSYEDNGRVWSASGSDQMRAYLNLIAARLDLEDE